MGSFYSHPAESSDDKKENVPGPMASSPYPGSTSSDVNLETDKTPLQTGGGLICDPRSPNPEISRTPISVTQGKVTSVNPLKGKVLGFSKQNSA